MAWVDLCAAICAQRHTGLVAVTTFIDDMKFQAPVKIAQVVHLCARVTATFRTSMEISVVVEGEDLQTRARWPCVDAMMVFVGIDEAGHPTEIPPLLLDSDEVRASQAAGEARRAARLAKKS
jgi:acyl-CoA hydrolase